jgi:NADH dehydrogenase FAD-containing subunit
MHTILIAGAGVGGLAAAHRLRKSLPDTDKIVVFDRESVHTFWPSLPGSPRVAQSLTPSAMRMA